MRKEEGGTNLRASSGQEDLRDLIQHGDIEGLRKVEDGLRAHHRSKKRQ